MDKRLGPKKCPHNILYYYGQNEGVACMRCGRKWKRIAEYIRNVRVTRLEAD